MLTRKCLTIVTVGVFVVTAQCDIEDGGTAPRLPLNDGHFIPALGLGTFLGLTLHGNNEIISTYNSMNQINKYGIAGSVSHALKAGYRLIDTTQIGEQQVGEAIHQSSIPREKIFIATKLSLHKQGDPVKALKESLKRLGVTYVDLYLIYFPVGITRDHLHFDDQDYINTWVGMEEAKKLGLALSIGVSHFNLHQMQRLLAHCEIPPAVLQIEVNLTIDQRELLEFCKARYIIVMACNPISGLFADISVAPPPKVDDPFLKQLATKYEKKVPQIVLRYLLQRGVVSIPASVRDEEITENINIFDFYLTAEEMTSLAKFNIDFRTLNPEPWQDHPYYPFHKAEEFKDPYLSPYSNEIVNTGYEHSTENPENKTMLKRQDKGPKHSF